MCVRFADFQSIAPSPDGLSWATAFVEVPEAVQAAYDATQAGGGPDTCEVWVKSGIYYIRQAGDGDTVLLRQQAPLYGGFAGGETARAARDFAANLTVLDGRSPNHANHVYNVCSGTSGGLIDGFVITKGYAEGLNENDSNGGGLHNNGSPTVRNCVFVDNSTSTNYFGNGGAIYNDSNADDALVVNSLFFANRAWQGTGGGIHHFSSSSTIINCTFAYNRGGGAIHSLYQQTPQSTVVNSIVWAAGTGASSQVVASDGAEISVSYSIVEGGFDGAGAGEGISDADPAFRIFTSPLTGDWEAVSYDAGTRTTILSDDEAAFEPGALRGAIVEPDTSHVDLIWSGVDTWRRFFVIKGNTATAIEVWGDLGSEYGIPTYVQVDDSYNIFDLRLTASSPAVDAADGDQAADHDLAGNARFDATVDDNGFGQPSYCDIGAYEYLP